MQFLGLLAQYLCFFILHVCGSGAFPKPLSEKKEREYLSRMSEGDEQARQILIEHNLRLVAHIVKKYHVSDDERDDLVSIGTIGLIKAVNTFKPDKNIRLSSYASRCIENEILMHFRSAKKSAHDILDNLDRKLNTQKLGQYIKDELTEREQRVIVMRYGLDGSKPVTQKDIAKLMNISRSYVSRIETKALKKLRKRYDSSSNL